MLKRGGGGCHNEAKYMKGWGARRIMHRMHSQGVFAWNHLPSNGMQESDVDHEGGDGAVCTLFA